MVGFHVDAHGVTGQHDVDAVKDACGDHLLLAGRVMKLPLGNQALSVIHVAEFLARSHKKRDLAAEIL